MSVRRMFRHLATLQSWLALSEIIERTLRRKTVWITVASVVFSCFTVPLEPFGSKVAVDNHAQEVEH